MPHSGVVLATLAVILALGGAVAGLWLTAARRRARILIPFSGGVLLGVSAFGLLPELIADVGWYGGLVLFAAGYLLLLLTNRFVYPVCPSCSREHEHDLCQTTLHGFAGPLVIASALHSFLDGWAIAAASSSVNVALPAAIMLHKVPEGIALGSILSASVRSRNTALAAALVAETTTIGGAAAAQAAAAHFGTSWIAFFLAFAGGSFAYLGLHAVHAEWKQRGAVPAFVPALTGVAGAAALQQGVRVFLR